MVKNNFKIEEVRQFWNSVAAIYDDCNASIGSAHYQRFMESMKYLDIKEGQRVLNIWCRTGNAWNYLNKWKDVDIYNLEVSDELIKIARKKYPKAKFEETNLTDLRFREGYFDRVLSLETLEHCPEPEKFLNELYRVLKPGGRLVMSLPPATAEIPLRIYELFFRNHGEGPHRFLPSKVVKEMLRRVGFKLILHKGTLLIPVGPQKIKLLGEKIIDLMQRTPVRELGIRQFYVCNK